MTRPNLQYLIDGLDTIVADMEARRNAPVLSPLARALAEALPSRDDREEVRDQARRLALLGWKAETWTAIADALTETLED